MAEVWEEEVNNLYEHLLKQELKSEEDPKFVQKRVQEIIMHHVVDYENIAKVRKTISLRRTISLKKVEDALKTSKRGPTKFVDLPKEEQLDILHTLGFDTSFGWCIDIVCTREGHEPVWAQVILGEERVDRGWTNKRINGVRVASLGATVAAKCGKQNLEEELAEYLSLGGSE